MFERISITPTFVLNKFFGYSEFREGQLEIINHILEKKDTLAILPTGGGKSICFQIPAILFGQNIRDPKVTIVVSPLISLMKDQVDALNKKGIPACFINSTLSQNEQREIYEKLKPGAKNKIKIVYASPERLASKKFITQMKNVKIGMVVVDEAHCISQWGNDFRPSYKKISHFYRHINPGFVKVAFTATANEQVQTDIIKTLKLENPFKYYKSFARNNLFIDITTCDTVTAKNLTLLRILNQHKNETGIIYCSTKKETENIAKFLSNYNLSATHYHGGVEKEQKEEIQNEFISGEIKLIVATNAFGMGIDKDNVRFVIHYQVPGNIENYYQEIGRAGRDGKPSKCYTLFHKSDLKVQYGFINNQKNLEQQKINQDKLNKIINLMKTKKCRSKLVFEYFGEVQRRDCGNCDNCHRKVSNKIKEHPLLSKVSEKELQIIKRLLRKKYSFPKPSMFLTDKEVCYLSIVKPRNKRECLNIPGLGLAWVNHWWDTVSPLLSSDVKI